MGAGSVISAMGNVQNMDRMGGFRKAMPFTFITFTVGALALAGFPLTAGFFAKDSIIGFDFSRGPLLFHILALVAYITAFMTAVYSFRMVFRVFFGEQAPEAVELEEGHMAHGEHVNPATGEPEDTDVGFPGPEHHIAEREGMMKVAMAPLAVLSLIAGVVAIPGVTHWLENFLEPAFSDSKYFTQTPSVSAEWIGLIIGGVICLLGIALAYHLWIRSPGTTARLQQRFSGLHGFLSHKWYFDELYDAVFVKPIGAFGSWGRNVVESRFVQGFIVDGSVSVVRAGTSFARAIQTGYLRAYALLLVIGVLGLGLYFLVQSS
jgi:NADH-quinone oxidoreductase subunit L